MKTIWENAMKKIGAVIGTLLCVAIAISADAQEKKPVYQNDFEKAEVGKLPDDLKFANGEFTVNEADGNKFLELPGAPLDSFSIQFGPTENSNLEVTGRIFGTSKGRRYPTFGVGINGIGGYRLQVTPAKKAIELFRDQDLKATLPYEWQTGVWTQFRLQIHKIKDGEWKIQGKVWPKGSKEPADWMISFVEKEEPIPGCASVFASPFSGNPIRFDDLVVRQVE